MKNDLNQFEKDLLKIVNITHGTEYNYRHLMEWSSNKKTVENNLQPGEIMYEANGCYLAINPKPSKD